MNENKIIKMLENTMNNESSVNWKVSIRHEVPFAEFCFDFKLLDHSYCHGFKVKSNGEVYFTEDYSYVFDALARITVISSMVINYNCELDKKSKQWALKSR